MLQNLKNLPQRHLVEAPNMNISKIDLPEEISLQNFHVLIFGLSILSDFLTLMNENAFFGKMPHHAIKNDFPRSLTSLFLYERMRNHMIVKT